LKVSIVKETVFQQVSLGQPVKVNPVNPVEASGEYRVGQLLGSAESTARDMIATAERQAQKILNEAHETARRVVEQAHQRASTIEEEATAKQDEVYETLRLEAEALGRETGITQGYEAAALETMELLQAAQTVLTGVQDVEQERLKTVDKKAVGLMQEVLKSVSKTVWQHMPETMLLEMWQEAVRVYALKGSTTLLVHPAQLQMIEALGDEATSLLQQLPGVRLKTDATLRVDAVYLMHDDHNLNLTLASVIEQHCQELLRDL
jgi:flagellar biosynthesis/type III secretory pathway protein FliH